MHLVRVLVDVSLCARKCISVFVHLCFYCVSVCVDVCLFVIDGALSPFPQLGLAA